MSKILTADKVTIATKEDFHTGGTFFAKINGIGRLTGTVPVGFKLEKLQKIQLDVSEIEIALNQTSNFNMTFHYYSKQDINQKLDVKLIKQKWNYYLNNEEWIANILKSSISPEWAIDSNLVIGRILTADKVTTATKDDLQEGKIFFVEFNGREPLKEGTMLIKFEMKFYEEPPYLTKDMKYSYLIINREEINNKKS
ncbi:hypothetical protein [Spiroplasma endosymbiont of Sarcophaga variegata]